MLEKKSFYKTSELCIEWKDKLSPSKLEYVFKNDINYGIYLDTFLTVALDKISDQYIPVAACVVDGVVSQSQPAINFAHHSLKDFEGDNSKAGLNPFLRNTRTMNIERFQFLPGVTEIYKWDESKPTIVQTESSKPDQKLTEDNETFETAVRGGKPWKFPSFDELHKQGSLEPEDYNVEGNSIFNSGYLKTHLHDFFRLQKNIDSWNPLKRNEVNEDELYFRSLFFKNSDLRVPHEDRMKIEKSFNSNQGEEQEDIQDYPISIEQRDKNLQSDMHDLAEKLKAEGIKITKSLLAKELAKHEKYKDMSAERIARLTRKTW